MKTHSACGPSTSMQLTDIAGKADELVYELKGQARRIIEESFSEFQLHQ